MKLKQRATIIIGASAFFGIVSLAEAKDIPYKDRVSGTAAPTLFNASAGAPASAGTLDGQSNRGEVSGGFILELGAPALDPACPATDPIKIPLVAASGARGFRSSGDQVFLQDDPADSFYCLNPATGAFNIHTEGNFIGGTGKFAGASGEYEVNGTGQILLSDSVGLSFVAFTFETKGKITVGE
jgi:hypothetical protein